MNKKNRWKLNSEEYHENTLSWNKTPFSSVVDILVQINQTSTVTVLFDMCYTTNSPFEIVHHCGDIYEDCMPHIPSCQYSAFPYLKSCGWCFIRWLFNINVHLQHSFNNPLEFHNLQSSQILLNLMEWKNDTIDLVTVPLMP